MKLTRTAAEVQDQAKCDALRPTESMYKGKPGYRQFHTKIVKGKKVEVPGPRKDGYYEWAHKIVPNVGGKLTREGHEDLEAMRPYVLATAGRQAKLHGAPGDYGQRGKRWSTRTVYHADGTQSVYRRSA